MTLLALQDRLREDNGLGWNRLGHLRSFTHVRRQKAVELELGASRASRSFPRFASRPALALLLPQATLSLPSHSSVERACSSSRPG